MQTQLSLKEMAAEELRTLLDAIEEELDDRRWDELLARPESDAFLKQLGEETRADIAAGNVIRWKSGVRLGELLQQEEVYNANN